MQRSTLTCSLLILICPWLIGGCATETPRTLDPSNAITALHNNARDFARLGMPEEQAFSLLQAAKFAIAQGDFRKQQKWLATAAALIPEDSAQSAHTQALLAEILQQQSIALDARGQLWLALETVEKATRLATRAQNPRVLAATQRTTASLYAELGKTSLALISLHQASQTAQAAHETREIARASETRAKFDYAAGRYSDAEQDARAAESQLAANDWFDEVARTRLQALRCAIDMRLANYPAATVACDAALATALQAKAGGLEAVVLNNRAAIASMGPLTRAVAAQAERHYRQALHLYQVLGDPLEAAITWNNIGDLYDRCGRPADALRFLTRALAIETKIGAPAFRSDTLLRMSQLCLRDGDLSCADQSLQSALAAQLQLGNVTGDSTPSGLRVGEPETMWRIFAALALLAHKQQNDDAAIFWGKMAVDTIQGLRSLMAPLGPDLRRSFLSEKRSVYTSLAARLVRQGRIPESEQIMALFKSEEYFEFINRGASSPSAHTATLNTPEQAGRNQLITVQAQLSVDTARQYQELLASQDPDAPLSPDVESRLSRLQPQIDAQDGRIHDFISGLQHSLTAAAATAPITDVRDNLRALLTGLGNKSGCQISCHNLAALQYIVSDHQLSIIMTTSLESWAFTVPIEKKDLWIKVEAYRRVLNNRETDPTRSTAGPNLYAVLMTPDLREKLREQSVDTLVLDLDGPLRYLPFAALFDGKKYLVESYSTVRLGRADLVDAKDKLDAHGPLRVAAFGVTKEVKIPPDDFPALRGVRSEIDGLLENFNCCAAIYDEAFTRTALILESHGKPIVHIATHFDLVAGGSDADSFLLLGDATRLRLSDMDGIHLDNVALLTLSACNTAMSADDSSGDGEEIDGLLGKAQAQGAKSVLATLWSVDDGGTAVLMGAFYKALAADAGAKTDALRAAQLQMLHGEIADTSASPEPPATESRSGTVITAQSLSTAPTPPDPKRRFIHPYYWAPFVLMGNWQ